MKQTIFVAMMVVLFGCGGQQSTADIKLASMQCDICKSSVETAIKKVDGVTKVEVDLKNKVGKVTYKAAVVDLATIEKAVSAVGYDANDTKADPVAYEALSACCKVPESH